MTGYPGQKPVLVAIDCIIFGFDGLNLKLVLIQRGFDPERHKWSLMGGFLQPQENLDEAATRILKQLTGLDGVYLEQMRAFGNIDRDPHQRTVSVTYFALVDIRKYEKQLNDTYHPEWFLLDELPELIFDHQEMVEIVKKQLRYKAALHPVLFELLPEKFTLKHLQNLYEGIYGTNIDSRNFSRKVLSTGLLIKQPDKDKATSKKGAFYYKLHRERYTESFEAFLNFVNKPERLIA